MDNTEFIMVFSSAGSQIEANAIAEELINKKLAACVSILPGVTSLYWWKSARESNFEVMMVIKTVKSKFDELQKVIKEIHSFEVPELLMVPVIGGSQEYLDWLKGNTE